jgi:hypothetical protein
MLINMLIFVNSVIILNINYIACLLLMIIIIIIMIIIIIIIKSITTGHIVKHTIKIFIYNILYFMLCLRTQ